MTVKRNRSKHPDTLEIMGATFTIKYVTKLKDDDDNSLSGEMQGSKRLITINLNEHDNLDELERTLLHEITHAVLYMSGLSEQLTEKLEESIVVALENGIIQLYKRN